jgi:teichuronic acid biosynthesis glycosyltransferase TuaH
MGKPVVATNTPFMEYFKSHTYLANSKEEFAELTAIALREDSNEKADNRIRYALTHTWEANVEAISDLAEQKNEVERRNPYLI